MARSKKDDFDNPGGIEKFRHRSRQRRDRIKQARESRLNEIFSNPETWHKKKQSGWFPARVVEVHKRYSFVSPEWENYHIETRQPYLAQMARRFLLAPRKDRNFICVGDRVLCRPAKDHEMQHGSELPQCVIEQIAKRKSEISRVDPLNPHWRHVLASNVDQIIITASVLKPRIKWGLIDRFLVQAEHEGITPIIIINKSDLLAREQSRHPHFYQTCQERMDYYRQLGYMVLLIQANAPISNNSSEYQALKDVLSHKISLLVGHSGVGKSSLVNLFDPEIIQDVEPDEDIFYKGRHTTSFASLIVLKKLANAFIIDTPGIRSLILTPLDSLQLSYAYRDFRGFLGQCEYRECKHLTEPNCAILDAVNKNLIARWRYDNYRGIITGESGREGRKVRSKNTLI